jgi:hypothetical protein
MSRDSGVALWYSRLARQPLKGEPTKVHTMQREHHHTNTHHRLQLSDAPRLQVVGYCDTNSGSVLHDGDDPTQTGRDGWKKKPRHLRTPGPRPPPRPRPTPWQHGHTHKIVCPHNSCFACQCQCVGLHRTCTRALTSNTRRANPTLNSKPTNRVGTTKYVECTCTCRTSHTRVSPKWITNTVPITW